MEWSWGEFTLDYANIFWWGYEKEIGLSIPTFFGGVELKMFGWGGKMFGKEPKKNDKQTTT